jgi:hypothetical protein
MDDTVQLPQFDGLPSSRRDPLVFHVLTGPAWRERRLADLLAAGARLVPPASRADDTLGFVGGTDIAAGDCFRLFFTVGFPYFTSGLGSRKALAFDLATLQRHGPVGWRVRDMASLYGRAAEHLREPHLRELSRRATVWDPKSVLALARLDVELLSGSANGTRRVDRILEAAERIVDREACRDHHGLDVSYWYFRPAFVNRQIEHKHRAGRNEPGPVDSEIVLEGELPLAEARFVYDGMVERRWMPMEDLSVGRAQP